MDAVALKSILQDLTQEPDLEPGPGVTHCNQAARKAAQANGCREFDDPALLADDMVQIMIINASDKWRSGSGMEAAQHALAGGLVFAAMSSEQLGEAHGHIASIYPAPLEFSPSLNRSVPMIANVGARNGVMKVSEAFPVAKGEPGYWLWLG